MPLIAIPLEVVRLDWNLRTLTLNNGQPKDSNLSKKQWTETETGAAYKKLDQTCSERAKVDKTGLNGRNKHSKLEVILVDRDNLSAADKSPAPNVSVVQRFHCIVGKLKLKGLPWRFSNEHCLHKEIFSHTSLFNKINYHTAYYSEI